jgi:hypothetical protein
MSNPLHHPSNLVSIGGLLPLGLLVPAFAYNSLAWFIALVVASCVMVMAGKIWAFVSDDEDVKFYNGMITSGYALLTAIAGIVLAILAMK